MVVTCNSFGVSGMDGYKVELEASMYNGTREFRYGRSARRRRA